MDTDDSSWVFDSLVCFLNGPVWNAPLQSFVEEKSLIFEVTTPDNPDYKAIYEEFKNLVDIMLGTYMEDIGITPEQFEAACSKQYTNELPLQFHKNLFEQIWAANDYNVFIRMMCQKNIELQLQALELIKTKHGLTSNLFDLDTNHEVELEDHFIINEIKKQIEQSPESSSAKGLEKISQQFQHQLQDELQTKKKELDNALESAITEATASYEIETAVPLKLSELKLAEPSISKKNEFSEEELKQRQEYLKSQRDKLVALKKQVREKQLQTSINSTSVSTEKRPKSAKMAKQILESSSQNQSRDSQLQIRKALAERLRNEVVSHKE